MSRKLASSFLVYGVSSSMSKVLNIFLIPVYTRVFAPGLYGAMDLITAVSMFLCTLSLLQLESAVSRYYHEYEDTGERKKFLSTVFWTIIVISCIIIVPFIIFSAKISEMVTGSKEHSLALIASVLIVPFLNIFNLFSVVIRFLNKPLVFLFTTCMQLVLIIGPTLYFILVRKTGIAGVFAGQLFGTALSVAFMVFYFRSYLSFFWDLSILKRLFTYSLPLVPALVGTWINSYLNRFIMLSYMTVADIGIYSLALKISSVFNLIDSSFRMAWSPFFWDSMKHNPDHRAVFKRAFIFVTAALSSLVILFSLFSAEMVTLLSPASYLGAASLVGFLCLSSMILILSQMTGMGPAVREKTFFNSLFFLTGVSVNVGCLFLLVPRIGIVGVPLSLLSGNLVMFILFWIVSEKLYFIGYSRLFGYGALLVCILTIVSVYFLHPDLYLRISMAAVVIICLSVMVGGMTGLKFSVFKK